jgi:hypothetical protein
MEMDLTLPLLAGQVSTCSSRRFLRFSRRRSVMKNVEQALHVILR